MSLPKPQTERPGTAIFRQGEPACEAFYLEEGACKLVHHTPDVGDVIVGLRGPGRFLAADAAILGRPHVVTAVTLSTCRISRLGAGRFRDLVRSMPELSWQLHRTHSAELYLEVGRRADLGALPARDRLLQFLDRFHRGEPPDGERSEGTRIRVPLKQWEIAQLLAIAPPYLCSLIGQLEREGLLRRDGDTLVLRRRLQRHPPNNADRLSTIA